MPFGLSVSHFYLEPKRFSDEVGRAWRDFNTAQWQAKSETIGKVIDAIRELKAANRYPAACLRCLSKELSADFMQRL
jgi:hypothetical protein